MNLWRRPQKDDMKIGGAIGYYELTDWWFSSFNEEERRYIDQCFQPWGERPHSLTQGNVNYSRKSLAIHLSDVARYLRRPEDLYLVRRILGKAEQEAIAQADIQGLDTVYTALMETLHYLGSSERYVTVLAREKRMRWH